MSPPDTPVLGALRALDVIQDRLNKLSDEELAILAEVVEERFGVADWDTASVSDVRRITDISAILAVYRGHREKRARRGPAR